ncbi:IS3 family transposase [Slackia sp.]|uniref:IS3 family transposase n=1 Tax=Slackia sp. TaxID=2049041 RepID=UPI002E78ABEE|nr:IS3 family transposase [Slackia sp.]MEE0518114.1 IS3 family transposase [Slackia sp.]
MGEEGRRRRGARRKPVPDGRGPAQAEAREREAEEGERDTFKSERLLRQQAAVGLSAKRAKFEFIFLNEGSWPVSEMCAALKVTRQGYYAWKSRPPSAHAMRDAELAELISRVGEKVRNIYGAPKTFMRLRALGVRTSRKRVARIMRERGWRGVTRACAKRPSGEKRASKRESALDLVGRRFEADGPNMAWFADITYVKTRQGWLYLALVMDIWSRRIVGWSMGPNITAELADEALRMALARRNPPEGCVHHSDSKNVASRFCGGGDAVVSCNRDRVAAS